MAFGFWGLFLFFFDDTKLQPWQDCLQALICLNFNRKNAAERKLDPNHESVEMRFSGNREQPA
jgi:hypothetical protein